MKSHHFISWYLFAMRVPCFELRCCLLVLVKRVFVCDELFSKAVCVWNCRIILCGEFWLRLVIQGTKSCNIGICRQITAGCKILPDICDSFSCHRHKNICQFSCWSTKQVLVLYTSPDTSSSTHHTYISTIYNGGSTTYSSMNYTRFYGLKFTYIKIYPKVF